VLEGPFVGRSSTLSRRGVNGENVWSLEPNFDRWPVTDSLVLSGFLTIVLCEGLHREKVTLCSLSPSDLVVGIRFLVCFNLLSD
jgi:hypothetical protein